MSHPWAKEARALLEVYPDPLSALLPILTLAQKEQGYLTPASMEAVAEVLGVTPASVASVASFYTMFRMKPRGKYLIEVCDNISCSLTGAASLLTHLEEVLGIKIGQTTADGLFTLETVECLAACGEAPALQVNLEYHGGLTAEKCDQLIAKLKKEAV